MKEKERKRKKIETDKNIVILYHAHCTDGFAAAWVAHKKFGATADYVPMKRGEIFPDNLEGKEVYVVDFSFSKEDILYAENNLKKFVIIDHHISSQEEVRSAKEFVFDIDYSGAYLAYRYFFPEKDIPIFIQYVSESDTYLKRLPDSEKYMPIVYARDMSFERFDEFEVLFKTKEGRCQLENFSVLIKEYEMTILRPVIESVHFVKFEGVVMPAVNATLPMNERSEALHLIYQKYPPVALMYRYDNGEWKCSLRSNGTFDCTKIAEKYGGGGHKGAAGFTVTAHMPLPFVSVASFEQDFTSKMEGGN